jgi:hypothetical protein
MKKIVTALFAVSLLIGMGGHALASDHFGELNLKAGCIINGKGDGDGSLKIVNNDNGRRMSTTMSMSEELEHNFSFAVEYLILSSHFFRDKNLFKFGLGLSYLPSLNIKKFEAPAGFRLSCLPIYFTLQVNPFMCSQDKVSHGVFIKGNIGYSLNLSNDQPLLDNFITSVLSKHIDPTSKKYQGGSYYGLSAGYEFPVGIIIDLAYCVHKFSSEYTYVVYNPVNATCTCKLDYTAKVIALNVGYKFKI